MRTDIFIGSLRNNKELCREFELAPGPDQDIIARGFEKAGKDFLLKCNGLFSFVLTDEKTGCRYCGRDRFGGKGLYYSFDDNGDPLFSETIRGIRLQGKKLEFNEKMLEVYLSYSYIPGEETAFKDIMKPLPGCCYRFDGGKTTRKRYFTPLYRMEERTEEEWETLLSDTLADVFRYQEKGGASLLSSGVDSSYLCRRLSPGDTYTAAYEDEPFSEASDAAEFSGKIGAKHHAVWIKPEAYLASVPETMRALEQPSGDASAEVLMTVCRAVKTDGSNFCYSGEGIDELFLGYYMDDIRKVPKGKTLFEGGYIGSTSAFTEEAKKRLLKYYMPTRKMEAVKEAYEISDGEDTLRQAALVDIMVWMNGNLLPNIFGMEQITGIRLIAPYLDARLYDLALRIPSVLQHDDAMTKKVFRKAAARILDREHAMRPKRGFPVPLRRWICRPDYENELKRTFASPAADRFFQREELISLYDRTAAGYEECEYWRELWCVYCFLIWYEEMIEKG